MRRASPSSLQQRSLETKPKPKLVGMPNNLSSPFTSSFGDTSRSKCKQDATAQDNAWPHVTRGTRSWSDLPTEWK